MASSVRKKRALAALESNEASYRSNRRRRSKLGRRGRRPFSDAIRTLRGRESRAAIDLLDAPPGPPPHGLDLSAPLWALIATGFPSDLDDEDRSRCEMIMGLAPPGSPPLDWPAVEARAIELFERGAELGGSDARLHLRELCGPEDGLFCQGRGASLMPMFGYARGQGWWVPSRELFDARRSRRRSGRPVPHAWAARFEDQAAELWSSGLSLPRFDRERRGDVDTWVLTARSVAQAMRELGCAWTARVPGFFSLWPKALEDFELMDSIDRDSLDPLRARWSLESAAGAPGRRARPSSL